MEDQLIIKLLEERSEEAIKALEKKYGLLCKKVAMNVVNDEQDAKECINDTWLAVWDKIPPEKPDSLIAYVCKVAKNLALKKWEYNSASKRCTLHTVAIDELENTLQGKDMVEDHIVANELKVAMNTFLDRQKGIDRVIFVRRYWLGDSISEIASRYGKSNNYVTVHLHRVRAKLKQYLEKEGLIK